MGNTFWRWWRKGLFLILILAALETALVYILTVTNFLGIDVRNTLEFNRELPFLFSVLKAFDIALVLVVFIVLPIITGFVMEWLEKKIKK